MPATSPACPPAARGFSVAEPHRPYVGLGREHDYVGIAKPRHHLLEASELMDGFGERLWPRTQLVQKLSEPSDGMVASVTISDDAGDNLAIEFEVVAAGRKPDQSVGHRVPVKNRAAPINRGAPKSGSTDLTD